MVDTVASIGQVATGRSGKGSPTSLDMGKQLALNDLDMLASMTGIVPDMKRHSQFAATDSMKLSKECHGRSRPSSPAVSTILASEQSERSLGDVDTVLNFQNFLIVETTSRREVWLKVNLKRPLLEFSHQFVEFPDTTPGSYSTMEVTLSALERELETTCRDKKSALMYRARFSISGDSTEILVQPSCGVLEGGESLKITLVAQPQISKEIVEHTAGLLKSAPPEPLTDGAGKRQGAKKSKPATGKKPDKKAKAQKVAEGAELSAQHLYPAEMAYWRSLEPYHIRASFTCTIDYEPSKGHKKRDKLQLDAICKVVRPDFIADLSQQRIAFGKCLIGTGATRTITIRNLTDRNIKPRVSLLSPAGGFFASCMRELPPGACGKLRLCFRPTVPHKVTEFMEIRSNATLVPLVLSGEGVLPVIKITPAYGVFRVETKRSKLKEVHLKIENASEAPASVQLEKLFEIEGLANKEHKEKTSEGLTEKELETVEKCFSKVTGQSHFAFKSGDGALNIPPTSSSSVTIQCGDPELLAKTQEAKHSKRGHKDGHTVAAENEGREEKQCIVQYNLRVGTAYIQSAVVVCSIKN
ncbi:hypothetical protein HUJ05_006041 [Dendroctonus ponderosae]|nr:hypothetical protein HUJ05_006041 [Dendroctonus ponderosae]